MKFRPLSVAAYTPTDNFKQIDKHMAICFDDDQGLVALTGTYDETNFAESLAYSNLFAAAPALLAALEEATTTLIAERDTYYEGLTVWADGVPADPEDREILAREDARIDRMQAAIKKAKGEDQ